MDPIVASAVSKGAPKLLEMVGRAIGKWYEPYHIRRLADAKAYEKLASGRATQQAKIEAKAITALDPSSDAVTEVVPILKRAAERLKHQEAIHQENLETIIDLAEQAMPEDVSAEPVDETWARRFFAAAADVSHEQMREVWAKILVAEVATPGTYSLRALDTLKNLSAQEALIFQNFCSFQMSIYSGAVYKIGHTGGFDACGISFNDVLTLRAAGLLSDADMLSTSLVVPARFEYHGKDLIAQLTDAQTPGTAGSVQFDSYFLTPVGFELSRLVQRQPNWRYVQMLATSWRDGKRLELSIAHGFLMTSETTANWSSLESIPTDEEQPNWTPSIEMPTN